MTLRNHELRLWQVQFVRNPVKSDLLSAFVFFMLLGLAGCSSSTHEKLVVTGSSTIAPLVSELARRFEELNENVRIDVQAGGSSRGISDLRSGLANIGMVSRTLKPNEQDLLPHTIAYDGIAIILNTQNPVTHLSDQQIISIYTGKIDNWQSLGGKNQTITVVNKAEGRSTLELFLHYFRLKNSEIKADIVIGGNQQGIKTVNGNPGAIAYVSIGSAEYEAQHGSAIKLLGVGGISASTDTVRNGKFPLSRPLNLITVKTPEGWQQRFIEFSRSDAAYPIIEKQFFVSTKITKGETNEK